jgi:hypothetical protein
VIQEGTRTAIRAEGEQISERSDAGIPIVPEIVQEVFGFIKREQRCGIKSNYRVDGMCCNVQGADRVKRPR